MNLPTGMGPHADRQVSRAEVPAEDWGGRGLPAHAGPHVPTRWQQRSAAWTTSPDPGEGRGGRGQVTDGRPSLPGRTCGALIWRAAGGMDGFLTETHVPQLWHRVSVLSVSDSLSFCLSHSLSPSVSLSVSLLMSRPLYHTPYQAVWAECQAPTFAPWSPHLPGAESGPAGQAAVRTTCAAA